MRVVRNIRFSFLPGALMALLAAPGAFIHPVEQSSSVSVEPSRIQNRGPESQVDYVQVDLPADFCGTDFHSDAAHRAYAAIQAARAAGKLSRPAEIRSQPEIGDEREFRILDQYGTAEQNWMAKPFQLVGKAEGKYYAWVDVDELGQVEPFERETLNTALAVQTPHGSIDPGKGVIENTQTYFGQPLNVDGDGVTDILIYDISLSGVGGFVTPEDFDPEADAETGNHADVIHIDSRQSGTGLAAIAAHEYTHLLHLSSGWDLSYTFATEGYAEYAMVLNGYVIRQIDYLVETFENGILDEYEYTRPLFDWRFSPSNGGPNSRDYQRGGLFFTYIGNQRGPEAVGEMLQFDVKGPKGIDSVLVLDGSSLKEIVRDFHTANLINDIELDSRFGYFRPGRTSLRADLSKENTLGAVMYDGERRYVDPEGVPSHSIFRENRPIKTGSVHYVRWTNVANVDLVIDSASYQHIEVPEARDRERVFQQGNMLLRVIGERTDGSTAVFDVDASAGSRRFNGRFESLTLVVGHSAMFNGTYRYEAQWTPLSLASAVDEPELPASTHLFQNYPNPFNPRTVIPFELERAGAVRLTVFDLLGRRVAVLVDEPLAAGRHEIPFEAAGLAGGAYVYHLEADGRSESRSMRLVK